MLWGKDGYYALLLWLLKWFNQQKNREEKNRENCDGEVKKVE